MTDFCPNVPPSPLLVQQDIIIRSFLFSRKLTTIVTKLDWLPNAEKIIACLLTADSLTMTVLSILHDEYRHMTLTDRSN